MRWRTASWSRWAAWLGVAALACNAAIPVLLAFMLGAALGPTRHEWVRLSDGEWLFYGKICRHDDTGGTADRHQKPHGAPCPVCSLHGTLALALPPPAATPPDRVAVAETTETPRPVIRPEILYSSGYRARAPPA